MTLGMTTKQVVETSVTVNNNSPIQDYIHPDDQTQPTFEMTPGFKPFTVSQLLLVKTKGYRVRATMTEGQNAFAPALCFA